MKEKKIEIKIGCGENVLHIRPKQHMSSKYSLKI